MERGSIEQAGSPSRYVPLRDDRLAELMDLVSLTVQTLDLFLYRAPVASSSSRSRATGTTW
jgi:hypothetical protein